MTAIVFCKYVFNGEESCNIHFSDGNCITFSKPVGTYTTDEAWIAFALEWYAANNTAEPDPMQMMIRCYSDQELVDECIRRHLVVTAQQQEE
jgi:hypothetical protein